MSAQQPQPVVSLQAQFHQNQLVQHQQHVYWLILKPSQLQLEQER